MLSLKGRYEARGLRVVSVTAYDGDNPTQVKEVADAAREEHMTYPCFLDKGSVWQHEVGTSGMIPYFFVVDKSGRIALSYRGELDEGSPKFKEITAVIERALAAAS